MALRSRSSSRGKLTQPSDRQIRRAVRFFADLPARLRRALLLALTLGLILLGLTWLHSHQWNLTAALKGLGGDGGQAVSTGFAGSEVATYSTALEVLGSLEVSQPWAETRYKRSAFGEAWTDIDHNGCDQRNDILTRDLSNLSIASNCYVQSGTLLDPYTALSIDFTRGPGTSEAVPIDHVVSLSNAWQSGAWQWSAERRLQLANDPLNLQAAGQESNSEKSDKDASLWLPQSGYRCEYAARQVSVKAAYGLTVTDQEQQALEEVLTSCPQQPAYRSDFAGS